MDHATWIFNQTTFPQGSESPSKELLEAWKNSQSDSVIVTSAPTYYPQTRVIISYEWGNERLLERANTAKEQLEEWGIKCVIIPDAIKVQVIP